MSLNRLLVTDLLITVYTEADFEIKRDNFTRHCRKTVLALSVVRSADFATLEADAIELTVIIGSGCGGFVAS